MVGPANYITNVDERPIGMFDSGFGGLTVARAVIDLLPNEHLVYFGDTGRYPYGSKSQVDVREFAIEIADHLVETYDIKMLVIACNTAAAAAFEQLETRLSIPVIGVIDAGVKALVNVTQTGRTGVIGTVGAIDSGAYDIAFAEFAGEGLKLASAACPGLVEFVERGETSGRQVALLTERLLAPIVMADVDTLLLGCTHYPFLERTIADVVGADVTLVSSADETAFEIQDRLGQLDLRRETLSDAEHRFLSSGDISWFEDLGRRLLGPELATAHSHEWPRS